VEVPVSPADCSKLIYKHTQSLQGPKHAVAVTAIVSHGVAVAVTVVVPRVVLRLLSSRRAWCRRRCRRAARCRDRRRHAVCGVTVAVVAPCGVVVALHVVVVAVVTPRVVSGSRSPRRGVLRSWWLSSCRVVPQQRPSSSRRHVLVATSSPHVITIVPLSLRLVVAPW
jgi:hypothetical protein